MFSAMLFSPEQFSEEPGVVFDNEQFMVVAERSIRTDDGKDDAIDINVPSGAVKGSCLVLCWDNKHSMLRGKSLRLRVALLPAVSCANNNVAQSASNCTEKDGNSCPVDGDISKDAVVESKDTQQHLLNEEDGGFVGHTVEFQDYFRCGIASVNDLEGVLPVPSATFVPIPETEKKTHKLNARLYMSDKFPISKEQLLPVAEVSFVESIYFS